MEYTKVFLVIAMAMALSITITMKTISQVENQKPPAVLDRRADHASSLPEDGKEIVLPSKRVSRFLAAPDNPRIPDQCHKDNDVCFIPGSIVYRCCNNKCYDLLTDKDNCGACKNKCKYTQSCCRGECVDLSYDKRHCGKCNNRCPNDELCFYGMCNYA